MSTGTTEKDPDGSTEGRLEVREEISWRYIVTPNRQRGGGGKDRGKGTETKKWTNWRFLGTYQKDNNQKRNTSVLYIKDEIIGEI